MAATPLNIMFAAYDCVKFYSQVVFSFNSNNILKFFGVVGIFIVFFWLALCTIHSLTVW